MNTSTTMSKEGVLACLKAQNYTQAEVRRLISQIETKEKYPKPNYLKVSDVFTMDVVGEKRRPCVIIAVNKNYVVAIPLTTTAKDMGVYKSSWRFGQEGWFSKQLITATYKYAIENYIGCYDNPKSLTKARRALKEYLIQNL